MPAHDRVIAVKLRSTCTPLVITENSFEFFEIIFNLITCGEKASVTHAFTRWIPLQIQVQSDKKFPACFFILLALLRISQYEIVHSLISLLSANDLRPFQVSGCRCKIFCLASSCLNFLFIFCFVLFCCFVFLFFWGGAGGVFCFP